MFILAAFVSGSLAHANLTLLFHFFNTSSTIASASLPICGPVKDFHHSIEYFFICLFVTFHRIKPPTDQITADNANYSEPDSDLYILRDRDMDVVQLKYHDLADKGNHQPYCNVGGHLYHGHVSTLHE
jgi:hypothetical protein